VRWAIVALAVIAPPMFVGWSLFRAAALGDCDAGNLDDAVCPGCDGFIEFDDDGSNICTTCGGTWWTP